VKTKFKNFLENFGSGDYASYDNSSDDVFWGDKAAGALIFSKATKRFLLNLRSKYVNEAGTLGLYGGKIDSNEEMEDAVRREFKEESAYDGSIELIPVFVFKSEGGTFEYHNFIGLIDNEFIPELDWESSGYKWVSYDELLSIGNKHTGLKLLLKDSDTLKIIKSLI